MSRRCEPPATTSRRSPPTSSSPSCATRCATASSTPTCIPAICSSSRTAPSSRVDFGISGRLGKKERRFLAEILYGFITRDYQRVAEVHFEAGYVPRTHDVDAFAQAIRAIGEPIHGQPAETISMARLLTLLFEVTELFDMQTRTELVLLQKTMVVVEGVARTLDPPSTCGRRPSLSSAIGSPESRPARHAGRRSRGRQRAGRRSPARRPNSPMRTERLSREIDAMAEHGLRFDEATARAIGKAEARAYALRAASRSG